jgi:UPF0755 protein
MKKRIAIRYILIIVGITILVAGVFLFEQYYRLEISNFEAKDGQQHSYHIYPGATIDSVMQLLEEDYDIAGESDFYLHAKLLTFNHPEPGHYTFDAQIANQDIINRLKFGLQTPVNITWNNYVRTNQDLAGKVTKHLMLDSTQLVQLLDSNTYLAQYGFDKETVRCLFIPNTYQVYWNTTPDALFARMQREYNTFWNDSRKQKADSLGLTPIEVAIVASIVEGESHNKKEMPLIASLYLNRIHKGMLLQACPTVKYAVGDFKLKRILNRHLAIDSPYNTYKYPGLPPGPIRCPAPTTIDMVLNAPKTDYLFMCASPELNNTHIFSSTFGKHAAAAVQYRHTMDTMKINR